MSTDEMIILGMPLLVILMVIIGIINPVSADKDYTRYEWGIANAPHATREQLLSYNGAYENVQFVGTYARGQERVAQMDAVKMLREDAYQKYGTNLVFHYALKDHIDLHDTGYYVCTKAHSKFEKCKLCK